MTNYIYESQTRRTELQTITDAYRFMQSHAENAYVIDANDGFVVLERENDTILVY